MIAVGLGCQLADGFRRGFGAIRARFSQPYLIAPSVTSFSRSRLITGGQIR